MTVVKKVFGKVPYKMKTVVIPPLKLDHCTKLYKTGKKLHSANCSPVYILQEFSKILKELINDRHIHG